MGLSSKTSKTKSQQTATVAPSDYARPYIDDAAKTFQPAYDEGMAIQRAYQPGLTKAAGFYGDTMDGKYLDQQNPYLDQIVADSNADITDSVNQAFMPRFGSGYHAKALATQLGKNETALRYGNYATERGYQNQAGQNMAGVATIATALPSIPSSTYAQNVGGLLGRYNTTTGSGTETTKRKGSILDTIGQIAQIAAVASDARLKTDVRRVGRTDAGASIYTYRYGGEGPFHMGVMAQEMRDTNPAALGPEIEGYMTVRYEEVR